ncbi:MAG TPA: hypothetical protein VF613_09835, partial [Longimicrobium sp.]
MGERDGWTAVILGIINGGEYLARFGDHMVPGDPVTAWDCTRATGLVVAHTQGFRDAGQGGASVSYTTPAYVSMDQPRSLTFTYYSGLADPRSQMQLNLLQASADAPERVMLEVRNREGARETLTDGRLDLAFRVGQGASRVSAEFREPRFTNLSATYTAVFRKYWADGRGTEERIHFRAANLDGRGSEFGQGWVLEGLQRLYDQGDGVHITEGATGLWFAQKAPQGPWDFTRHFSSPSGDFSTVTKGFLGYERSYPDGRRVIFGMDGRMLEVWDRFGNMTKYEYDDVGRLVKITDPAGLPTTLGYTGTGALAWVQDPAGRRSTMESFGSLIWRIRAPDNSLALDIHWVETPDRGWSLDSYWTPAGDRNAGLETAYTFGYDKHGRVASVTAPGVFVTEAGIGDNALMRPVVKTSSLQMSILGTGWLGNEVARVRPEKIRVKVTGPRNDTTSVAVDPYGTPVRVEEPLGRLTYGTTDRHGRMLRSVSPTGNVTAVEYVGVEQRTAYDEGTGAVVRMEYDDRYHLPRHIWGSTTETWNFYGAQGQLDSTRVDGKTTRFTYGSRGRVRSVTDPSGHTVTSTYGDESGGNGHFNLHYTEIPAVFRRQSRLYDAYGRVAKSFTSALGDTVRTEYDLLNRVTRSVDGGNGATMYGYSGAGLTSVTNPKQQTYTFSRNALGWTVWQRDPRGQHTYYRHDRAGNVTSTTSRQGRVITAGYDPLGRSEWRAADGQTTYWRHDPGHRWSEVSNAVSTDRTEFDVAGRPTRTLTTRRGATYTAVHTLDAEGSRTRLDVY